MTTPAEQESLASSLLQRHRFWWAVVLLLVMLASLQYRLWFAEGSLRHTAALEERLAKQQMTNSALKERNDRLSVEVSALQHGSAQMEAHARE
ncbi:MAG: hypothetical protein HKO60_00655, partial [Pseudomonadales bacterium]|nr:hypothetical protein [Pseudomonadales bacterium]